MGKAELAQDVYGEIASKIVNYQTSSFFREHEVLTNFEPGFEAITNFLLDRPLMLVNDTLNIGGVLSLLDNEWYEAEHAISVEGEEELAAELGDTLFFGLLAGMLFWDEMNDSQREFVDRSMQWSMRKSNEHKINILDSVVYVASKKDPVNYPVEFYQLIEGESASQATSRFGQIGKLHREIRGKLNGEWKDADDLLNTLARHWFYGNPETDGEVLQIENLFALAGIDLLAQLGPNEWLEGGSPQLERPLFDQLKPDVGFLTRTFESPEWAPVVEATRMSVIERVIPASENGVRNVAVAKFAEIAHVDVITVPGSDRELTWSQYLTRYHKEPDLVEYQAFVAMSKHNRLRRMSEHELERIGVFTDDHIESRTAVVAFDTIIQIWDGEKYVRGEKPESEEEAIATITAMMSGEPFLVSTVSRVQNLLHNNEVGSSATILPVRVVTRDRFERAELLSKWIELYRSITKGGSKPWKMTPAGPSLMHPMIQPYLEIGVGKSLSDNVLPAGFTTFDFVDNPGSEHKPFIYKNIGPLAYKRFAESILKKGGYYKMRNMTPAMMQSVGMVFSGYSDIGMLTAFERYISRLGNVTFDPYAKYRDRKLMSMEDS